MAGLLRSEFTETDGKLHRGRLTAVVVGEAPAAGERLVLRRQG